MSLVNSPTYKLSQSAVSGEKTRQCSGGAVLQCCVTARLLGTGQSCHPSQYQQYQITGSLSSA